MSERSFHRCLDSYQSNSRGLPRVPRLCVPHLCVSFLSIYIYLPHTCARIANYTAAVSRNPRAQILSPDRQRQKFAGVNRRRERWNRGRPWDSVPRLSKRTTRRQCNYSQLPASVRGAPGIIPFCFHYWYRRHDRAEPRAR